MERSIEQVFVSANILKASLKHNGLQGGDSGHGGFVTISLKNESSTYMEVNGRVADQVSLTFKGDTERETLLQALKFFVEELETHS